MKTSQYAKLLDSLAMEAEEKDQADQWISNFLALVKKNRDEDKLEQIIKDYEKIYQISEQVVVEIISAKELSVEELGQIKKDISQKKNVAEDKVVIKVKVDGELKKGMKIKIGAEVVDGSLKGKIEKLRAALVS